MAQGPDKRDLDDLIKYCAWNKTSETSTKVIEFIIPPAGEAIESNQINLVTSRLRSALRSNAAGRKPFLETFRLVLADPDQRLELPDAQAQQLMSMLTRELPNEARSEEHTSELQSRQYLVCRLLLEKKKTTNNSNR